MIVMMDRVIIDYRRREVKKYVKKYGKEVLDGT
jgi:hypothetical protein